MNIKNRIKDKLEESKNFLQMSYEQAKKIMDELDVVEKSIANEGKGFPRLPNGLPVETVRITPEYQNWKKKMDIQMEKGRQFGKYFARTFKKEIRQDMEDRKKNGTYGKKV